MLVQIGSIYMNNTWKYLTPVLTEYGSEFVERFNSVWKVAVGIGDMILIKNKIRYEQHLFVLLDSKSGKKYFTSFMEWIKDEDMYEDDYCFDDIHTGRLHMVIIKLPKIGVKAIENMKHSRYSNMFSVEKANEYFANKPDLKKVIIKDNHYKFEFVEKLNHLYDTTITPEEYEGELELPIRKNREYFNIKRRE